MKFDVASGIIGLTTGLVAAGGCFAVVAYRVDARNAEIDAERDAKAADVMRLATVRLNQCTALLNERGGK